MRGSISSLHRTVKAKMEYGKSEAVQLTATLRPSFGVSPRRNLVTLTFVLNRILRSFSQWLVADALKVLWCRPLLSNIICLQFMIILPSHSTFCNFYSWSSVVVKWRIEFYNKDTFTLSELRSIEWSTTKWMTWRRFPAWGRLSLFATASRLSFRVYPASWGQGASPPIRSP
jgi:hypothetical protein